MNKTKMKNEMKIVNEKLEKIFGGLPGIAVPGLPDTPYVTAPGDYSRDDEPRDGGATGSW